RTPSARQTSATTAHVTRRSLNVLFEDFICQRLAKILRRRRPEIPVGITRTRQMARTSNAACPKKGVERYETTFSTPPRRGDAAAAPVRTPEPPTTTVMKARAM